MMNVFFSKSRLNSFVAFEEIAFSLWNHNFLHLSNFNLRYIHGGESDGTTCGTSHRRYLDTNLTSKLTKLKRNFASNYYWRVEERDKIFDRIFKGLSLNDVTVCPPSTFSTTCCGWNRFYFFSHIRKQTVQTLNDVNNLWKHPIIRQNPF